MRAYLFLELIISYNEQPLSQQDLQFLDENFFRIINTDQQLNHIRSFTLSEPYISPLLSPISFSLSHIKKKTREWERYQVERQKDQASISDLYNSLRPPLNHSLISHHHSTIPQTMDSLPRSNLKLYIESYLFSLYTQLQKLISRGFLGREERERRDGFTLNRFELDLLLY